MDNPLNILFISNRGLLPIRDGHTRRSFNILKGLAEKNNIYFLSLYETPEEINISNIKELESFCQKVEFYPSPSKKISIPMIARLFRSFFSSDPYTIWRHYSKKFQERVKELINYKEFDLIHCDILPLAYTVRNVKGVFRSITDHDVSYLKCLRMSKEVRNIPLKLFLLLESWKLKRLESRIFKQVDLGITVSEKDKKILQSLCPEGKFVVIENGVEIDKFFPSNDVEPNTLIWVGGFDHYSNREGINYFLKNIYPEIKKNIQNIRLIIIGGNVTKKIKKIADSDKSIKLLGYVNDPIPFIQRATIFIVPLLSGSGTRLKILEALALGKAVVTTSIGCEGIEGINKIHYLVADNINDFVKNILIIINNQDVRRNLETKGRKLVMEKYDWKNILEKINKVYKELINNNS